jgi:hypothetical protein
MSRILMRYELWKSVEDYSGLGFGRKAAGSLLEPAARVDSGAALQPLRACSACAGDYEDPDRTAWGPDAEEDEADTRTDLLEEESQRAFSEGEAGEADANGDEFPAQ